MSVRRAAGGNAVLAVLAVLLWLGLAQPLPATELGESFAERWRWVHFTTWSGLPSDEVLDLVEDADGTPWVATSAGLAWYDGHRWRGVTPERGLPTGYAGSLATCPNGDVCVVVNGEAYQGNEQGFSRVRTPAGKVNSVACLDDGSLLVQVGLDLYRVATDGSSRRIEVGGPGERVSRLFACAEGRVVVSTSTGLLLTDGDSTQVVVDYGPVGEAWADIRQALAVTDRDVIFSVIQPYWRQGAWLWREGSEPRRIDLGSAETVLNAAARPDGTIVLAYESGAIGLADGEGNWTTVDLPAALGGVTSLVFRDNGDLWAGTARGLWLCRVSSERWAIPARSEDAEANVVHSLMRARDGRLWVGTRAGFEIRDENGGVESYRSIGARPTPVVTAIAQDGEGAIWLGSGSGFEGAWRWKDGEWTFFSEADGLLAPHVHAIRIDSRGRPWFLGLSRHAWRGGAGAFVHDRGGFTSVALPGGEHAQRVYDLVEGPPGTLWFGTAGGLHRLTDGRWRSWLADDPEANARVFALELDSRDRPWLTDGRTGACHLPDDETLHCESTSEGLPNDAVWDFGFDSSGALWASTRGGLAVRRDGHWSEILPKHGLPLLRLWPLLVEEDRLLVGTNGRGLAELRLSEARHPAPRVSFLDPDAHSGVARVTWNADAWWGAQAEREVETRWRLNGGAWSGWGRKRELVLEDLAHGEHLIEVQAKGLFGQRDAPERLAFEVPAPLIARPEVLVPIVLLLLTAGGWLGYGAWRRRAFAQEIARREQRFSEILDNVADAIFTVDLDGRLTSLNRAGLELAGITEEDDLSALRWEELMGPESRERAMQALAQKQRHGGSSTYEIEGPGPDGEPRVLEIRSRLVRSKGRQPEIQGVARDVTERRRFEQQLHHAQKLESLGLLAGGVAHDFNNLLLSILGNLDLARGAWRDGRSPAQAFDDLEAAAERATDLARVMLAYSGKARFEIRPLDLSELAEEILRLLKASLPKSVEFETELAEELPAIEGDRAQVQQIILNLVTNAADAVAERGGRIRVRTGSGRADECRFGEAAIDAPFAEAQVTWLEVADDGPGIDAETRARIFDPFFTTKGTGRGLGLSAVLGIVRSHGGALDIEGRPGARFRVLFPAVNASPERADTRAERARRHAEDISGARVLVVDDEDRVRDVACRLLERAGCEVLSACDGLEAQELVREQAGRIDAVLLDLVMPRCSGAEALKGIREMAPDLPVVLTSGYTEEEASAREVGTGATSFLVKPYRLADLEGALRAAFAGQPTSAPD